MIENFKRRFSDGVEDTLNIGALISAGNLTNDESHRLSVIREAWNFYEGYHWEGIDNLDSPQVTFNYCRAFVNKFVSFELGKGFTINTPDDVNSFGVTINDDKVIVNADIDGNGVIVPEEGMSGETKTRVERKNTNDFLNDVWNDNKKDALLTELGQSKSVSGDAWIKVQYEKPEDLEDPFGEYPNGRVRISVVPTQYVFPRFDNHDKDRLESLLIMYPIRAKKESGAVFKRAIESTVIYKEVWTKDSIEVYEDGELTDSMENPYGLIPFVQIKNFPVAGRTHGVSDLEDIIPLNVEINTKKSDVSEVIDYHSAPITLVYGARIGNLEKGANKVWGGLPKDSRVENLALQGDLSASVGYISSVKTAMCEIAGIPETVLGGATAISNTSGVALQYMNLPLIERTRIKKNNTREGLEKVNKLILFIALSEGLIEKPDELPMGVFVRNEVEIPETLPKDELIELQKIQQEMSLGLESRRGALERMGTTDNVQEKLDEIDAERSSHPELYNPSLQEEWYQSNFMSPTNAGGMLNGQTPNEQMNIAKNGENKAEE
nr:MAG TPA: portal protein [Caudoviricetes sp.]